MAWHADGIGTGIGIKGGGVSSVHLLYSGVVNICLCGFPLTGLGVAIWLCWYRWLATSVGFIRWRGSTYTRTGLTNIPRPSKLFANFGLQLLGTKKTVLPTCNDWSPQYPILHSQQLYHWALSAPFHEYSSSWHFPFLQHLCINYTYFVTRLPTLTCPRSRCKLCCPINTLIARPYKSSSDFVSYIFFICNNLLSDDFGR